MALLLECCNCGRTNTTLSFVGGQWWCRNCLFEETYDFNSALVYVLANQDTFADRYPEGYRLMWEMLRNGDIRSFYLTNSDIDEFISDHLEDYAEWVMTDPYIPSFEELSEKAR